MTTISISPPSPFDICQLKAVPGLKEVLLQHGELARGGTLDNLTLITHAQSCREADLTPVFVWDVLASDENIERGTKILETLPQGLFDQVRVQDVGVACYLHERFPQMGLQLVLETGNHNLIGIQTWLDQLKPQRLILSNELPLETLAEIRKQVDVPVELGIMGRLLIFYSPRKLLSAAEKAEAREEIIERFATEELSGKHFPIVENRHGTFMFYEKDLFLLPYLKEVTAAGIDVVRLDLDTYSAELLEPLVAYLQGDGSQLDQIKSHLAPRLTRGFFKSNRTDKQFVKLKNPHLVTREDMTLVGEVVETAKKRYTALFTKEPISVGDTLTFAVPEGNLISARVDSIRDSEGGFHQQVSSGLWLLEHVRGVSTGSLVYR